MHLPLDGLAGDQCRCTPKVRKDNDSSIFALTFEQSNQSAECETARQPACAPLIYKQLPFRVICKPFVLETRASASAGLPRSTKTQGTGGRTDALNGLTDQREKKAAADANTLTARPQYHDRYRCRCRCRNDCSQELMQTRMPMYPIARSLLIPPPSSSPSRSDRQTKYPPRLSLRPWHPRVPRHLSPSLLHTHTAPIR